MKRFFVAMLLCAILTVPFTASADNIARDYIPASPGTLAILMYYSHITSDTLISDGQQVSSDVDFRGNVGLFRPVYYTKVGPFVIDPQFIIPFGDLNLETSGTGGADLSSSGIGDPIVFATIWLYNNPQSKTWLGFTPFFFIPIGNYDNNGALTLGENRWRFREEFGFVQGFEVIPDHNAYFEIQLGADFLTENDDFGVNGASLEQDPIFNVESHLSYDITKSFFVSADYYGHFFGEQRIAGVDLDNRINSHTLGGTLGFSLAPNYQLLFQYKGDVEVENGLEAQTFTARFLYATDFLSRGSDK